MKRLIKASAWIYAAVLVLSMFVAKAGHPWLGMAAMLVSFSWLGAFVRANYFEGTQCRSK